MVKDKYYNTSVNAFRCTEEILIRMNKSWYMYVVYILYKHVSSYFTYMEGLLDNLTKICYLEDSFMRYIAYNYSPAPNIQHQ